MICFPNAKINLGLHVVEKRADGFHNIETVFYPIKWCDVLEVVENKTTNQEFILTISGLSILGELKDNLLYKAYQLMKQYKPLPYIHVYLHKVLPMGAGLGGGSADAAFFINLLNTQFCLNFSSEECENMARQLGSDCAFFIKNKPVYATQKGDLFSEIEVNLHSYYIAVVYPNIHSNTKEAYSLVSPKPSVKPITQILQQPIDTWKEELVNDFERSIFHLYPEVKQIKEQLYQSGALYACMSGSGSAVFGIFNHKPNTKTFSYLRYYIGKL